MATLDNLSILYMIGQLDRGGAEQQLYNLLANLKPNATLVSFTSNGYWATPIRQLGYRVIELKRAGSFEMARLRQVISIIRTVKPDIVHLFLDSPAGLYGRIGALLSGHRRLVVGERNHPTYHARWYQSALPWLNRGVKMIVCNSEAARDYMVAHRMIAPRKVCVIPNGLDIGRFQNGTGKATSNPWPESWHGKRVVGTVGHLTFNKNPEMLVRVAADAHRQNGDLRFAVVGEGPRRAQVQSLADSLGLSEVIQFFGERKDVPDLLHAMDIFVLTSRVEGMPNAIMEAMAAGLPCLATDSGGCRELVHDGETGFVVPIDDDAAFANRLLALAGDESLRCGMGAEGQVRAQSFSLAHMAERYGTLYRTLME